MSFTTLNIVPDEMPLADLGYLYWYVTYDGRIIDAGGEEIHQYTSKDRRNNQYKTVSTNDCGKQKNIYVHRLVALKYVYNPDPKRFRLVNHIDGNKLNNHYTNLEWTDHKGNLHHAKNTGLMEPFKITEEIAHEICRRICAGQSATQISRELNLSYDSVAAIHGKKHSWLHVSNQYNFPPRKARTSPEVSEQIYELLKQNVSVRDICSRLNVTRDVVKERQSKLNKEIQK